MHPEKPDILAGLPPLQLPGPQPGGGIMARPRKRKKWDPVGTKDKEYFPVDDLRKILKKAGVTVSSSVRDRDLDKIASDLELAAEFYFSIKIDQNGPTTSEIKAALEDLGNKANALIDSMENLDFRTKHFHLLWDIDNGIELFDITLQNLRFLSVRAENESKKIPQGSPGPHKDKGAGYFLSKLGDIYCEVTGQDAGHEPPLVIFGLTKPFINFAFECLNHIGEPPQSWSSLKQRIHRIQQSHPRSTKN